MKLRISGASVSAALLLLALSGCKDATTGPILQGSVAGRVLDYRTGTPIAGASVTTSPPSEGLLTDASGEFRIEGLDSGNYQITARKYGYDPTSVAVAVRDDRTSNAVIFLDVSVDSVARAPTLEAAVLSFWNSTRNDSVYVETEYRVRNTGEVPIEAYEVYFRLQTGATTYFHDVKGVELAVGQSDTDRFQVYVPSGPVTAVQIDTIWTDPPIR